jgi:hypothetical protein
MIQITILYKVVFEALKMNNPYGSSEVEDNKDTRDMSELSDTEIEANRKTNEKIAKQLKAIKNSGSKPSLSAVGQLLSKAKFNVRRDKSAKE